MGTLAVGGAHTCAVTAEGGVECWGDDADRQVGDRRGGDHLRPFAVPGLTGVRSVVAGQSTSCAVTLDGRVSCWGRLDEGVLGDPLAGAVAAPKALPSLPR